MNSTPHHPLRRRRVKAALIATATLVGGWLVVSILAMNYATRRAAPPLEEPTPAANIQVVDITASDGVHLGGWLIGERGAATCVLLLHGNGGSRSRNRVLLETLAASDRTVLSLTHRAHGDSEGTRNDLGASARHDVVAGVAYLEEHADDCDIFVVARSLGSAATILAAPLLEDRVTGYLLESPYTTLEEAIRRRVSDLIGTIPANILVAGMRLWSPLFVDGGLDSARPLETFSTINGSANVVLISGSEDRRVTPEDIAQFVERRPNATQAVFVDGARHAPPLFTVTPSIYLEVLEQLVDAEARGDAR